MRPLRPALAPRLVATPSGRLAHQLAGDIPCFKLYESARVLAFLDIQPLSRGHAVRFALPPNEGRFPEADREVAAGVVVDHSKNTWREIS